MSVVSPFHPSPNHLLPLLKLVAMKVREPPAYFVEAPSQVLVLPLPTQSPSQSSLFTGPHILSSHRIPWDFWRGDSATSPPTPGPFVLRVSQDSVRAWVKSEVRAWVTGQLDPEEQSSHPVAYAFFFLSVFFFLAVLMWDVIHIP